LAQRTGKIRQTDAARAVAQDFTDFERLVNRSPDVSLVFHLAESVFDLMNVVGGRGRCQ
jgi:hypothetical protein